MILVVIILLILARCYIVQPLLIVEIPADGLLNTLLELEAGLPAEFLLQLRGVDGIAQVVTGTVGDVCYQVHVLTLLAAKQTVYGVDEHLDDVDVLPLIETTDIVCVSNLSVVEDDVDGTCMVSYIEPVAHVLTLARYGQRLAVADIVDEQRYQLLGELVRTIVV